VESFVLPLLRGGAVVVGRPFRPRDFELMQLEVGQLRRADLGFARLRRTELLSPSVTLPDPDAEEVSLWIGLHNTLVFDHPERMRVWARGVTWRRAEGATRTLLTLPTPDSFESGLARHIALEAFLELRRRDTVVATATGDVRYLGQEVPRRRFRLTGPLQGSVREDRVAWIDQTHAPETVRLTEDAMRASPLTCLLDPLRAPPGWSPLSGCRFLQQRGFARAICQRWASQKDWIAAGGAVMSALLPSLPNVRESAGEQVRRRQRGQPLALPGAVLPSGPQDVGSVVGALIHLHFLKVFEVDARLGHALGSRDPGVVRFLALPLLLARLQPVLGSPTGGGSPSRAGYTEGFEAQAQRRWIEYIDHLRELVPRATVENLLASLVPAIVRTQ